MYTGTVVSDDFRNSSHGYYGGSIELLKRELPEGMIAITDDWQA